MKKKSFHKNILYLSFVLLLILASGFQCTPKNSSSSSSGKSYTVSGTDGLTLAFVAQNPQDRFSIGDLEEPISIIFELRNKGSWPQTDGENILSQGKIYVSGFDDNIIVMNEKSKILNRDVLRGASQFSPEGGFDMPEFKGAIRAGNLVIDKYEPIILGTACFPYATKASPSICVDPHPFDTTRKKVCQVGAISLTSQGAPIAVTKVEQESSSSKTQFKITIKNVGGGDILRLSKLDACDPYGGTELKRSDFDKVELSRVSVGTTDLRCGPFIEANEIRLFNNEGFIICTMEASEYQGANSAYQTPLNIELRYGYRKTVSKPIKISKISGII